MFYINIVSTLIAAVKFQQIRKFFRQRNFFNCGSKLPKGLIMKIMCQKKVTIITTLNINRLLLKIQIHQILYYRAHKTPSFIIKKIKIHRVFHLKKTNLFYNATSNYFYPFLKLWSLAYIFLGVKKRVEFNVNASAYFRVLKNFTKHKG